MKALLLQPKRARKPATIVLSSIQARIEAGELPRFKAASLLGISRPTLRRWLPMLPLAKIGSTGTLKRWAKRPDSATLEHLSKLLCLGETTRRVIAEQYNCSEPATYRWIPVHVANNAEYRARCAREIEFNESCNCKSDKCKGLDCQ